MNASRTSEWFLRPAFKALQFGHSRSFSRIIYPNPPTPAGVVPKIAIEDLSYFVRRTGAANLPVYEFRKRGGNLHLTYLKKVEGDINQLRVQLRDYLGLEDADLYINQRTQHLMIKGLHKTEITTFLRKLRF